MNPVKVLWRWRNNPLKRPSDVVEAAVLLLVLVLVVIGGPGVGVVTGRAAHDAFRNQRLERYPATAVLVDDAPGRTERPYSDGGNLDTVRAPVRWRDARSTLHRGVTQVEAGRKAGSGVAVWLDGSGRLTQEPLDATGGVVAAALVGVLTAVGWGAVLWGVLHGVRHHLRARRIRQWEREWAEGGPRWHDGRI
ncbi:Rv1733c family protein [Streptomyces lunalinharesii]|uniref:Uncharacterized protein n=1 Tax=Streptomyces lunalinharesii TaxID=333384 RepID=A0ABN3SVP3_9ACTN